MELPGQNSTNNMMDPNQALGSGAPGAMQPQSQPQPQPRPQPTQQAAGQPQGQNTSSLLDALVKKGKIQQDVVQNVQSKVVTENKSIEQAIAELTNLSEEEIYRAKAEMTGVEFVDVASQDVDISLLQKVPSEVAKKNMAVAFTRGARGTKVAMIDPLDIQKTKYLSTLLGGSIEPVFSTPTAINYVIDNKYGAQVSSEVEEALEDVEASGATSLSSVAGDVTELGSAAGGSLQNAPVSKIVNMILEYSIKYKASDIHIEPQEKKISVRFRIFGVLSEKLSLPAKLLPAIVSRIKILANLKIDEHRIPQDGRFQVRLGDNVIDLRVSIVPTVYGEKVVMRLLKKGGGGMSLEQAGMAHVTLETYKESLKKTQGIILVTGPTGSGKTQTLASSLKILNEPEVNIMTLENPVEIRIDGVNQVQINEEVGLTFAKGLRSFLRQDPDIIMVGEIRDSETATLAVQAALTGHLVLATLHTNSAAGAVPRLIDMGVEPFLLSSTMNVVVAQRLVRRLCEHCKEAYYAEPEAVKRIHQVLDPVDFFKLYELPNNQKSESGDPTQDKIVLYKGKGCSKCNDTGYQGRVGIFEAIDITDEVSSLIVKKSAGSEINEVAVKNGTISMLQDGFMKALKSITTIEEVMRVQTH
jgi:type IV pilus assembly protein PilB